MKHILAVGFDYDRTLTNERLELARSTIRAIRKMRRTGIISIILSGRTIEFLLDVNQRYNIGDILIGENGAVIFFQDSGKTILPSKYHTDFRKIFNNSIFEVEFGTVIASVKLSFADRAIFILKERKVAFQIRKNIDSVMFLPPDVDKGVGLKKASRIAHIKRANVAVIGDGENDLDMFKQAGLRVAVANAVDSLKEKADIICKNPYGKGVIEFIENILCKLTPVSHQYGQR